MVSREEIYKALAKVIDPELGIDIVSLGLIYRVEVEAGEVTIEMTLTTPGCPLAPVIDQLIRSEVNVIEGVSGVTLNLVWDPPWMPDMISEEAKEELGLNR